MNAKVETTAAPVVHIYVQLDRSGSMASMVNDVIGGFNQLLLDQQADGADACMTLVQFDSSEPQQVIANAVPITEMKPLDKNTFVPRGSTPLLDATGTLLASASARAAQRVVDGLPAEEIMMVSITDGEENASHTFSLPIIRQLIQAHTAAGWSFVFLGAALDVYGEASQMGIDHRSTQSFQADSIGAELAFDSLSKATLLRREKVRAFESFDKADFFENQKPAENDRTSRQGN